MCIVYTFDCSTIESSRVIFRVFVPKKSVVIVNNVLVLLSVVLFLFDTSRHKPQRMPRCFIVSAFATFHTERNWIIDEYFRASGKRWVYFISNLCAKFALELARIRLVVGCWAQIGWPEKKREIYFVTDCPQWTCILPLATLQRIRNTGLNRFQPNLIGANIYVFLAAVKVNWLTSVCSLNGYNSIRPRSLMAG